MCAAKETVPLKSICTSLAQKPSSLDVMLLFVSPAAILQPLSELLDAWRYEDDQGTLGSLTTQGSTLIIVTQESISQFMKNSDVYYFLCLHLYTAMI